jgi:hypothetical protein
VRAPECPPVPKCTRLVPARSPNLRHRRQHKIPICRAFLQALRRTRTVDPLLTIAVTWSRKRAWLSAFPAIRLVSPLVSRFPRRDVEPPRNPRTCPQDLAPSWARDVVDGGNERASPWTRLGRPLRNTLLRHVAARLALSEPFSAPAHLPPVATGCDRSAPSRLHPQLSSLATRGACREGSSRSGGRTSAGASRRSGHVKRRDPGPEERW